MGDFHQYYSGEKRAPVLTLVIGGNHEASNYLSELYYGGWLAPNIYYLGAVGVVRYGACRIAGISGIYNRAGYHKPHHESLPFDRNEIRSVYHVRQHDVFKLLQIRSPIDIGISHDWPRRIEWFGDYKSLFASRPNFFESAKIDKLGSAPAEQVMSTLRPRYWFSGHMHIKYCAAVEHSGDTSRNIFKDLGLPDELQGQLPKSMFKAPCREGKYTPKTSPPEIENTVTHFLALDKPGLGREFLELLEIDSCGSVEDTPLAAPTQKMSKDNFTLCYDEEWLAIIRSNSDVLDARDVACDTVLEGSDSTCTNLHSDYLLWIRTNVTAKGLLTIPQNFRKHAPIYSPTDNVSADEQLCEFPNSQTDEFCKLLQIHNRCSTNQDTTEGGDRIIFE